MREDIGQDFIPHTQAVPGIGQALNRDCLSELINKCENEEVTHCAHQYCFTRKGILGSRSQAQTYGMTEIKEYSFALPFQYKVPQYPETVLIL